MTLTEVNYYARKFAPVAVIMILVMVIIFFAFQLLSLYFKQSQQANPEPAKPLALNPIFNKIKAPIIPRAKSSTGYTYILDTLDATAKVENATSAAQVYFIPKQNLSFGFLPQIYLMAKSVGIDTENNDHKKVENTATFDDGKNKLEIDISNFNFSYDYVLSKTGDFTLDDAKQPSDSTLKSNAESFLRNINRYPDELSKGDRHVIYINFDIDSRRVSTLDAAEGANMAEVDFYRPDFNGYPVVTSSYYNSPHFVLFGFSNGQTKVIRSEVKFYELSDKVGTYPLKTSDEAWADLKAGKGTVVSANNPVGEVHIKKISLGYYDPDVYQEYFQPVYIFLGDDKFVAYVTAVRNDLVIPTEL
jgi:hypothetical protein